MGLKKLFITLVLSLVLLPAMPALADSTTVGDISKELICQCGCGTVLADCSHAECSSRETMAAQIEQKLAQGQSQEQILELFVAQYGEQVLAALPKRGFNLIAWVMPFTALLFGGGIIYTALRAWVRRGKNRQTNAATKTEEGDEQYRHQLEKELEEFTEGGFR